MLSELSLSFLSSGGIGGSGDCWLTRRHAGPLPNLSLPILKSRFLGAGHPKVRGGLPLKSAPLTEQVTTASLRARATRFALPCQSGAVPFAWMGGYPGSVAFPWARG